MFRQLGEPAVPVAAPIVLGAAEPAPTSAPTPAPTSAPAPVVTERRATVWIAQPADALRAEWESLASAIRQRGFAVRPLGHSTYPLHDGTAFRHAVEADLGEARLFVQLLGAVPGPVLGSSATTIDAVQSALARLELDLRADATFIRWRSPDVDVDKVADEARQQLLRGAVASGFEPFRQQVLDALDPPRKPAPLPPTPLGSLTLGVTGGPRDAELSSDVARIVEDLGQVPIVIPPTPAADESPASYREALDGVLASVDGIVLVHGRENEFWVRSRHAQFRKALAQTARGVWGAHLDTPPPKAGRMRIPDPAVVYYDCTGGVGREPIERFVDLLRRQREPAGG